MAEKFRITTFEKVGHFQKFRFNGRWWSRISLNAAYPEDSPANEPVIKSILFSPKVPVGVAVWK